jgi:purine-binding chemotaxis protein CheW
MTDPTAQHSIQQLPEAESLRALFANPAIRALLEERADALAHAQEEFESEQGEEVLTFRLGDGGYTLPAHAVQTVQPLTDWTPLPTTPPFIMGLVNVRGKILTMLDLRPLLQQTAAAPGTLALIVIVGPEGEEVALLADEVEAVRRGGTEITPTLSAGTGQYAAWVRGLDDQHNLVIDPAKLLADPAIVVDNTAT